MITYTFHPRSHDTLKNLQAAKREIIAANFATSQMTVGYSIRIGSYSDAICVVPGTTQFCSTLRNIEGQYNLEQFELYHSRACQVLRICEKYGLLQEVVDRSGFWETQNLEHLRVAGKSELELMSLLAGSDNSMAQAMLKIAQAEH
jgi:hypothetical protein